MIIIFTLTFSLSSYFIVKRCYRDRTTIRDLTSNTTVVPAELVENEIVIIEIVIQPTVPEIH
jgi:hypothetical protein